MFPIRPVPENNVKKPEMFVFKDMDDYKARGKNVDAEYVTLLVKKKKVRKKQLPNCRRRFYGCACFTKAQSLFKQSILGKKRVKHKSYGEGIITGISNAIITVSFDDVGEKKLGYEVCIKNKLIEII